MKKIMILIISYLIYFGIYAQKNDNNKPNVIYIYADDLGYGELGCYGQEKIETPHLDKMAQEGIRFTQHYAGSPVSAASRCILLTGRHSGKAYIRGNYELGDFADDKEGGQMPLHENTFTLGHLFKNAGYVTATIGKWGLGMSNTTGDPLKQGFDYFYGYLDQKQAHNYYPTHLWENGKWDTLDNKFIDVHKKLDPDTVKTQDFKYYIGEDYSITKMTEKALSFINKNSETPFFLYLPYTLPHVSLQAPEDYINHYISKFDEKPYYGQNRYAPSIYPLSTYAAMISYLDSQIGIIMNELKKLGIDENTIIMFSSDNGPTFNGGVDAEFFNSVSGLRGLKMDLFEGGIRVPFIARWPQKIAAGRTSDLISNQYDMMTTFADITKQEVLNVDGISLLPELIGNQSNQQRRDFLFFEFPDKGGQIAIRIGKWKAVKINMKNDPNAPWMLFDLIADINETTDIAPNHPEIIQKAENLVRVEHQQPHLREWEFINPKFPKRK